jgi:alkylhydroperoxidase family enzyme
MPTSATLASMEWETSLLPAGPVPPPLRDEVRRLVGTVPAWVAHVAPVPWLVRGLVRMQSKPVAFSPPALCDLIALAVSQDNSCRYCFGIQRTIMRVLGYREAQLERLERDHHLADLTPAERAALAFARKISRASPRVSPAERDELAAAGYTPLGVAEIAFVAAATVFANRGATLLALPPEPFEKFVERPLGRLLRPLLARKLRARPRRPEPLALPNDGPCAAVVRVLDGSPAATVLRQTIDEAWASPVLPRRTKALLLAVIGRALGCTHAETEATGILAADGLGASEIEDVLATLSSPRLDGRERRLVPFARDTARYDHTVPIQRRMREAAEGLRPAEILEAVGVMALANTVCRLSVLLDFC